MKKGLLFTILLLNALVPGFAQSETITLRVLYYLNPDRPTNSAANANLWFSEFTRQYPNVRIERENLYDEPFHDRVRAYAAAGNLPDVMYVWPSGHSDYLHDQRLLKDLTPLINRDNLRDSFLPVTMDPSHQQAGYMAMIPQGITTTHAFYINMEVLNDCGLQPAETYAELKAQVPVLRAKGYETILIPAESNWVMQSCLFSMIAGRFCGASWHDRILNGEARFTDPDFVNALNFFKQLFDDGVIQRSAIGVGYGEGPEMFAANRSAYYIDGDWRVGAFLTDPYTRYALISASRQKNFKIGVFPDIPGARINSSSSVIIGTGYGMSAAIPAGSPREEAAWNLIKYLTGREVSQLIIEHEYQITTSRTDLNFQAMRLEPMQRAIAELGRTFTTGTVVIDGVFDSDVYSSINSGLTEIALGIRTPQRVAADVQRAFDVWRKNR
jgi:raffinose/stachyose/melibiose transport system substrate-binding protein